MKQVSLAKHFRDILILPFTVTVVIPWLIYNAGKPAFAGTKGVKFAGALLLAAGLSLFISTVYLFRTFGQGTLAPWTPTQKLIILGPYKYCRNPMITGVLSILLSEALLLQSRNILILACVFFVVNTIYFILIEEPDLYGRFGEEYGSYKKNVPRWIPRLTQYKHNG